MTYYDAHPALTCTTTQNKLSSFALQSGSFARVPLWQGSPGDRYELRSQPQRLPMISWAWQPTTGLGPANFPALSHVCIGRGGWGLRLPSHHHPHTRNDARAARSGPWDRWSALRCLSTVDEAFVV